jgi:hypothetical protein
MQLPATSIGKTTLSKVWCFDDPFQSGRILPGEGTTVLELASFLKPMPPILETSVAHRH